MRRHLLRSSLIVGLAGSLYLGCATAPADFAQVGNQERSQVDRPDEFSGPQVHLLYVLPKDRRRDKRLDTNGTIGRSVAAFQKWFASQPGGRQVRIDMYRGEPDITFVQLSVSDAEIRQAGKFARDRIETELNKARALSTTKIYVAYYEGGHNLGCGDSSPSPFPAGNLAVLYLRGTPPDTRPCKDNPFAPDADHPGYLEFATLHEIFHLMGAVASGAPHYSEGDHVKDKNYDLMYGGNDWDTSKVVLDVDNDDYYGHNHANVEDVEDSPFLQ